MKQRLKNLWKSLHYSRLLYTRQSIDDTRVRIVTLLYEPNNWVFILGVSHIDMSMLPIATTHIRVLCFQIEIEVQRLGE